MGGTILCVDDDRNLSQILSEALRSEGYEVSQAFDGDQALEALSDTPPDLLMLDLILPRRDGFALLEAIRGMDATVRDIPALIMTGCSPTPENRRRATALGAVELMTKPIALDELLRVVSGAMVEQKPEPDPVAQGEGIKRVRRSDGPTAPKLAGSLKQVLLPSLLHHLHGLRATGVLHLVNGRKRKWIQLNDGCPCAVRSNLVNECLGNFLVRQGQITQAALAESRRRMKPGRLQGEILVAMDLLSEVEIAESLTAQAEEKLFETFGWSAGRYRFEKGVGLARGNALGLVSSPANLIVRGVRNRFPIDRVDAYLRSQSGSFLAQGDSPFYQFQEVDLDADQRELLGLLDGSRKVSEFLDASDDLKRTLYALLAVGLLELRREKGKGARGASAHHPSPGTGMEVVTNDPDQSRLMAFAERIASQSFFELLGVEIHTSVSEVRRAYERLAAQMHPDRYSHSSQAVKRLAEEVFGRINQAYETLVDPTERKKYIQGQRRQQQAAAKLEKSERALEAEKCFRQGQALLSERAYERALEAFGKALELFPDEGEYHSHYGWTLHLCHPGESTIAEEAIEHVKRGIKLAGHRETSYLFMGRLYKAIGQARTAEMMFMRAVQIQPECVEALRELRLIDMRRQKSRRLIGRWFRR